MPLPEDHLQTSRVAGRRGCGPCRPHSELTQPLTIGFESPPNPISGVLSRTKRPRWSRKCRMDRQTSSDGILLPVTARVLESFNRVHGIMRMKGNAPSQQGGAFPAFQVRSRSLGEGYKQANRYHDHECKSAQTMILALGYRDASKVFFAYTHLPLPA